MSNVLFCKIVDEIAIMEINRTPYNPLNKEVIDEMTAFILKLYKNPDVRVLLIKGAGEKAFSAGADIHQFVPMLGSTDLTLSSNFHRAFELLSQLPIPVIAALKGHVLGGGFELALSCDFRICEETTKLGLPEVNLGIFPGAGGTQRLPRLIGKAKALEMIMFGTSIDATEALNLGIVNKVVPVGQAEKEAFVWANKLKQKSRTALRQIKKVINRGVESSLSEGLNYEMELFAEMFTTEDAKEGIHAFIEKRTPIFNGKVEEKI